MPHQPIPVIPPRQLNITERNILNYLLSVEFQGNTELRYQADKVLVSEICKDCLSIGFKMDRFMERKANTKQRVPVEAEGYDIDGMKIHILLFVDDGYLDELEIFREDLGKIQGVLKIEEYQILNA